MTILLAHLQSQGKTRLWVEVCQNPDGWVFPDDWHRLMPPGNTFT